MRVTAEDTQRVLKEINPNNYEGPDGIHAAVLNPVIIRVWQKMKKAVGRADEWDVTKRK